MTNLDPSIRARDEAARILPHSLSEETALDYEKRALGALAAALAPMTPLVLDREAVARADWKDVAHRLAGLLDAMMLYCTYPNDSHPRDAMAALNYVWKPLGFRGSPRMAGQIEPAPHITPPLPNLSSAPADSIIALTSQAGGLVEEPQHYTAAMNERPVEIGGVKVGSGLYRLHWKSGGSSLAAIGMCENGSWWVAPVNWVAPAVPLRVKEDPEGRFSWACIERLDLIDTSAIRASNPSEGGGGGLGLRAIKSTAVSDSPPA